jgi:hypothetical protein
MITMISSGNTALAGAKDEDHILLELEPQRHPGEAVDDAVVRDAVFRG